MKSIGYDFEANDDNAVPTVEGVGADPKDIVPLDQAPADDVEDGGIEFGHMLGLGMTDDDRKSLAESMDKHAVVEQYKSQIDENNALKGNMKSMMATNRKLAKAVVAQKVNTAEQRGFLKNLKQKFMSMLAERKAEIGELKEQNCKLAERCKMMEAKCAKDTSMSTENLGFLSCKLKEKQGQSVQLASVVRSQNAQLAAMATELQSQRLRNMKMDNDYKARIESILRKAVAMRDRARQIIADRTQLCNKVAQQLQGERAAMQQIKAEYQSAVEALQSDNDNLKSESQALKSQLAINQANNGRVVAGLMSKLSDLRSNAESQISMLANASEQSRAEACSVGAMRREIARLQSENNDLKTRLMRREISEGKDELTFDYDANA